MRCFITNRDCKIESPDPCHGLKVSLKDLEAGNIFMISPFKYPYDDLFHLGVAKTINDAAKAKEGEEIVTRGDKAHQLGYVICQRICKKIRASKWVFADLTEPNGNVYYELGLAFGMNRGIVLLSSKRSNNLYRNSFLDLGIPMLEYSTLADLKSEASYEQYLSQAYLLPDVVKHALDPHAVLDKPATILNVLADDCPSLDLHSDAIDGFIKNYNKKAGPEDRLEDWHIKPVSVGCNTNIQDAVGHIAQAKICLFDTTHYEDKPNAMMFFLLGVAHAAEREGIPLVNTLLNRDIPFDIKGLWQVNFQRAEQLIDEFGQILPPIDKNYKKDKADYPYRRVWDSFSQSQSKEINVITCARENVKDDDRGARTDIDLWDFESVSELSFFIAQMYESIKVKINKPKNKPRCNELMKIDLNGHHRKLRAELEHKDTIIIGSPDVSDYAEVVLADLYGVEPHIPREKEGWLPFRFVKKTKAVDHPRNMSAFYRLPVGDESEMVEFGKSMKINQCAKRLESGDDRTIFNCTTYVVITIADMLDGSHMMVISGFTGIATYAAMQLLTDPKYKPELLKYIEKRKRLKDAATGQTVGINVLVSVGYTEPAPSKDPGDRRDLVNLSIVDLELIPRPTSWPSSCQTEGA